MKGSKLKIFTAKFRKSSKSRGLNRNIFNFNAVVTTILVKFIWQPSMFFLKTRAKALDAVSGKGAQIRIEMIPIRIEMIPIRIEMIPIRIDDPDFGIGSFQISSSETDIETETLIFI